MLEELPRVKDKAQPTGPAAPANPAPKGGKKWRVVRRVAVGITSFVLLNLLVLMLEPYFLNVVSFELNHTTEKILLYQQQPAPDILLMGSSRVENGLDPAVIEQTIAGKTNVRPRVLNLGIRRNSLELNYLILKNIIQDDKKPSVIVYGLAELELNDNAGDDNYFESITGKIPNSEVLFRPDDLGRFGGSQPDQQAKFLLNQLVPLVRDQKLILKALNIQFNSENINHAAFLKQTEIPQNGYVPMLGYLNNPEADINSQSYKAELPAYKVQNTHMEFFKAFLDLAKAKGIKVVLVNMPASPLLQSYWQDDNKIERYRDTVENFARENGAPLLDVYQDSNQFPRESFFDTNHLNSQGATVLSQMLAENYLAGYFNAPEKPAADFYNSKLTDLTVTTRLPSKTYVMGTITVQKLSSNFWPTSGNKRVRVAYHWLNADGSLFAEGLRTDLSYNPGPGEKQTIPFNIKTPDQPGQFILQADLVYGPDGWFSEAGGMKLQKMITIEN